MKRTIARFLIFVLEVAAEVALAARTFASEVTATLAVSLESATLVALVETLATEVATASVTVAATLSGEAASALTVVIVVTSARCTNTRSSATANLLATLLEFL